MTPGELAQTGAVLGVILGAAWARHAARKRRRDPPESITGAAWLERYGPAPDPRPSLASRLGAWWGRRRA